MKSIIRSVEIGAHSGRSLSQDILWIFHYKITPSQTMRNNVNSVCRSLFLGVLTVIAPPRGHSEYRKTIAVLKLHSTFYHKHLFSFLTL